MGHARAALAQTLLWLAGLQNVPEKYLGRLDLYNRQGVVVDSYPAREGAADTDVLVLVTMQNDADVCGAAGSGAIAWAL